MYKAKKTIVAKHNDNYYKLIEGKEIPKMPKDLVNALIANNYVEGTIVETKTKKRTKKTKKEQEIIPEEELNLSEVYNKEVMLDIPEEEHIISKEGTF